MNSSSDSIISIIRSPPRRSHEDRPRLDKPCYRRIYDRLCSCITFILKPENLDAFANIILLIAFLSIIAILVALIIASSLGTTRCGQIYAGWIIFSWEFIVILGMIISKYYNQWWLLRDFIAPYIVVSISLSLSSASLLLNRPNCGGAYVTASVANGIMCCMLFICLIVIYSIELGIIDPMKAFPPIVPDSFVIARDCNLRAPPFQAESHRSLPEGYPIIMRQPSSRLVQLYVVPDELADK